MDQEGQVIDILVRSKRDTRAASRFFRKLVGKEGVLPRRIVTDRLGSYRAAMRDLMPGLLHLQDKGLNNRAENSHQPTRERERPRNRFRSSSEAQRFLSTFSSISNQFREGRHLMGAVIHRVLTMRRVFE